MQPGELLWTPGPDRIRRANVTALAEWLARERGWHFADYRALWRWSVEDLEGFWQALWDYFAIESSAPHTRVLGRRSMPGAEWFPGARLNYAQHVLRRERAGGDVLHGCDAHALSGADGRVRLALPSGRGRLYVHAPDGDFLSLPYRIQGEAEGQVKGAKK